MSRPTWNHRHFLRYSILCWSVVALALLTISGSQLAAAQDSKKPSAASATGGGESVARGKYIVEEVAMCGNCHTPRLPDGELDRSRPLAGASNPYLPARPNSDWPINCPRLAGTPPASNEGMVTLLTTGVWITGQPLRDPMPKFHMTRSDAEAVVSYLRSLR
jgi:mono/diheme cytochrome c family protein